MKKRSLVIRYLLLGFVSCLASLILTGGGHGWTSFVPLGLSCLLSSIILVLSVFLKGRSKRITSGIAILSLSIGFVMSAIQTPYTGRDSIFAGGLVFSLTLIVIYILPILVPALILLKVAASNLNKTKKSNKLRDQISGTRGASD